MPTIQGTAVAPGLALGPVHVVRARSDVVPIWTIAGGDVEAEVERLAAALEETQEQLGRQRDLVHEATGSQDAEIFSLHRMVLQDPSALGTVKRKIREERINAEGAVQSLIDQLHQKLAGLDGANVRQPASDMSDPWRVVLDVLLQREREELGATEERVVLAAAELTPQVATFLGRTRILAIITETGGRFSHGAVLARSFGIPCVVGLQNLLARLEQNMQVAVDGDVGTIELRPDKDSVDQFIERRRLRALRRDVLVTHAMEPAITPDGKRVSVMVNLESIRDLDTFDVQHSDGTGLLRTEFLYMERSQFPSEEEQFRMYRRVVDAMEGRPVVIRTLDIGGDKPLSYFQTPVEANPALGWRGLRVTLEWQDLFRVQLRAILRASAHGDLRILLPMVTSLEEVEAAHEIFEGVRAQLVDQGYEVADDIPVGVMIEVPSSVWILDQIVEIVDFISVGTNDLTQYLLAVDRDNPFVEKLYEPLHPAMLRVLNHVAQVTNAAGKSCSVCGEVAADDAVALLLVGMGYDSLSVAPNFLADLRFAIRQTTMEQARELARLALKARSPVAVRALMGEAHRRLHRDLAGDEAGVSGPT
ncbi:MAG: phosphoenolpyruvate--protein phosphotransferase [Longimicrobiales bacterium]